MIIPVASLTPQDFKNQFPTDFNYLPIWISTNIYYQGQKVYYAITQLFYICQNNGVTSIPTTIADWTQTSDSVNNYIQDSQIQAAFNLALTFFNPDLGWYNALDMAFLYLTAHFLIKQYNINAGGLNSGSGGISNSKSAGNVSESYTIPEWQLRDPNATFYNSTSYGTIYYNLLYPRLIGRVQSIFTSTNP